MPSYPNIIDVVGSYDPGAGVTTAMVLFTNSGGNGYITTNLYDSTTGTLKNTRERCLNTKIGLAYKSIIDFVGVTNYIDVSLGNCSSGEICNPPSCSSVNITGRLNDNPVYMVDYSTPPSPVGVDVISGDGALTFIWNKNTNIFAYYLVLTDPSLNVVDAGYLPNSRGTYTFSNLTNGVVYTLHIYNVNQSDTPSSEVTKPGVPGIPPTTIPPTTIPPTTIPPTTIPPTTIPPEGVSGIWIAGGIIGIAVLVYLMSRKK